MKPQPKSQNEKIEPLGCIQADTVYQVGNLIFSGHWLHDRSKVAYFTIHFKNQLGMYDF